MRAIMRAVFTQYSAGAMKRLNAGGNKHFFFRTYTCDVYNIASACSSAVAQL